MGLVLDRSPPKYPGSLGVTPRAYGPLPRTRQGRTSPRVRTFWASPCRYSFRGGCRRLWGGSPGGVDAGRFAAPRTLSPKVKKRPPTQIGGLAVCLREGERDAYTRRSRRVPLIRFSSYVHPFSFENLPIGHVVCMGFLHRAPLRSGLSPNVLWSCSLDYVPALQLHWPIHNCSAY